MRRRASEMEGSKQILAKSGFLPEAACDHPCRHHEKRAISSTDFAAGVVGKPICLQSGRHR